MKRAEEILVITLLQGFCLLAGCTAGSHPLGANNRTSESPASNTNARSIVGHVFEAQASPSSMGGELLIPASLSVEDTAIVLAEREGRVINLHGDEGTRVNKGDLLAVFNDDDQRSQLRQAEIEVSRLKVEEQQYEAQARLNRSEYEREVKLAEDGVSSKSDVERAKYRMDQAAHEYEKSRLATESAEARIEAVKIELAKSTVRAPIAGIITRRYVALGTNVARNDKLFEVSRLAPLEVKFQLPQSERERVSPGQVVNLSAVNSDQIIARARVRRINPVADPTMNTLGYLADVEGGSGLMPGLAVNLHLPRPISLSFWIPRAAFPANADLHGGAQAMLFIVEGDRASARTVTVSVVEGDQVEIVSGLANGDRVILMPPANLKDGDVIEVGNG